MKKRWTKVCFVPVKACRPFPVEGLTLWRGVKDDTLLYEFIRSNKAVVNLRVMVTLFQWNSMEIISRVGVLQLPVSTISSIVVSSFVHRWVVGSMSRVDGSFFFSLVFFSKVNFFLSLSLFLARKCRHGIWNFHHKLKFHRRDLCMFPTCCPKPILELTFGARVKISLVFSRRRPRHVYTQQVANCTHYLHTVKV